MKDLFRVDRNYLIIEGYLYLPLLYDPETAAAADRASASESLFRAASHDPPILHRNSGSIFVKSLSLASLLEHYPYLFAESLREFKAAWQEKHMGDAEMSGMIRWDETLKSILFQILPHFVRKDRLAKSRHLNEQQVLDGLLEKVAVPSRYSRYATKWVTSQPLEETLQRFLELPEAKRWELPADGWHSGEALRGWLFEQLEDQLLRGMKDDAERLRRGRQVLLGRPVEHIALLLYLMDKGALEVNGFGFYRSGPASAYAIYRHTGEYALKDYYGRLYLFPDCRVAVLTDRPLRPVVLEKYKHPFLPGFVPGQEICLGTESPAERFSASAAIRAIEAGIGALFYGYNSRQRNGYHSLDSTNMYVRGVAFDEYRVAKDHDKITGGRVEVKNAYF